MRLRRSSGTVLFSSLLVLAGGLLRPPSSVDGVHPDAFWAKKLVGGSNNDVVLAGDSRVHRGLSPARMQETLKGSRILNFGFNGCGFTEDYLKEAAARLNPQSESPTIVLSFSALSLTFHAAENNVFVEYEAKRAKELQELIAFDYFLRFLRPLQLTSLQNFFRKEKEGYFQTYHRDGWVASYRVPEDQNIAIREYAQMLEHSAESLQVSEERMHGVMASVRRWSQSAVAVYGLRMPVPENMERFEAERMGFDADKLRVLFEDSGGVWLDLEPDRYHSYDGSHLRMDAALKLSDDLAKILIHSALHALH